MNSQKKMMDFFSKKDMPILMKTADPVNIMVFGVVTNDFIYLRT